MSHDTTNFCPLCEQHSREAQSARAEVDDLATLVRTLVRKLNKAAPDNDFSTKAMDYLKRKGLQGSPLREEAQ